MRLTFPVVKFLLVLLETFRDMEVRGCLGTPRRLQKFILYGTGFYWSDFDLLRTRQKWPGQVIVSGNQDRRFNKKNFLMVNLMSLPRSVKVDLWRLPIQLYKWTFHISYPGDEVGYMTVERHRILLRDFSYRCHSGFRVPGPTCKQVVP